MILFVAARLCAVRVKETSKAVGERRLPFARRSHRSFGCVDALWQRDVTFVTVEGDLAAFVGGSAHHASSRIQRIVNGVGRNVGVAIAVGDVDDDQIVDVFHVLTDRLLIQAFVYRAVDDEVASSTVDDLIIDMTIKVELAFSPFDFDLA